MSATVNEYGLGSPDTQAGEPVPHDPRPDPLAHGLGPRDVAHDNHGGEDVAEGGRRNTLEHGLSGGGVPNESPTPTDGHPDPLQHGLGSPETGSEGHQSR